MDHLQDSCPPIPTERPIMPCLYLLDCSGSMTGEPIQMLNASIGSFVESVATHGENTVDVDICMISFATEVKTEVGFRQSIALKAPILRAEGATALNQALLTALDAIKRRIEEYKAEELHYLRPMLFVVTDGSATDIEFEQEATSKLQQAIFLRKISYAPIAVGYADENRLRAYYPEEHPSKQVFRLSEKLFSGFFSWPVPSAEYSSTTSEPCKLPPLPPNMYISV